MQAMRTLFRTTALLVVGIAVLSTPAAAHPGHAGAGLASGLLHPFGGADHLLAMVAVGLLASRAVGSRRWSIPAGFVGFMLVGGLVAALGLGIDAAAVEVAIIVSVLLFGAMVCALPRVSPAGVTLVVAGFALFHGYAHVAEMGDASMAAYFAGMALGTACLHAAGLAGGLALRRVGNVRAVRIAGATLGLAFLVIAGVGA